VRSWSSSNLVVWRSTCEALASTRRQQRAGLCAGRQPRCPAAWKSIPSVRRLRGFFPWVRIARGEVGDVLDDNWRDARACG
jgi:hypothetical protein